MPVQLTKVRGLGDSTGTMHYARISRRYSLKELVVFSYTGEDALQTTATGLTENVSTTGIAFVTDVYVETGSFINLNLHIRSATDAARTILLHAEGTVLRVESAGARNKVAAAIRFQDDFNENIESSATIH